jgi:hypothetical protein
MSDFLGGFASENEKKWFELAKITVHFLGFIALKSAAWDDERKMLYEIREKVNNIKLN